MKLNVPRGYRSKNLEDRRQELETLDDLLAAKDAARREEALRQQEEELRDRDLHTPPWLRPSTTPTLYGTPRPEDITGAFSRREPGQNPIALELDRLAQEKAAGR